MLEHQFICETLGGVCIQPTRSTAYCLARLAGCPLRMHRGQPALDRHQPVAILVETSGYAAEGADSSATGQSVSVGGSTRSERAGPGVWVGTPGPVDCPHLDGHPPTAQSAASTLPEGSQHHTVPHAEEKRLSTFEIFYTHIPDIYSEGLVATA